MRPDINYPGLHFSERWPEFDVHVYAQDGASMGMISYQFDRARQQGMQAFVIGLGAHDRLEFWADHDPDDKSTATLWWCGNHHSRLSQAQQDTAQAYQLHACDGMSLYKSVLLAKSMFLDLQINRIPYAWTNNLLYLDRRWEWLAAPVLQPFLPRRTGVNFSSYRPFMDSPGFHVPDPVWQNEFAQQCRTILAIPLDS